MAYSRAKWRKQTRLQLLQQTQPQSQWRWINSMNNTPTTIQTPLPTIASIASSSATVATLTQSNSSSASSSSRDGSALTGLAASLPSDRFGNAFPYLKPSSAANPFHSLFGLSSFNRTHTPICRDYSSVPSMCSCTSIPNIPIFPHRPTPSLPPICPTNSLEISKQSKSEPKKSPKSD